MATVTREDVRKAAQDLGIQPGDTVLIHSSFKSMGTVEGGAETVISGFLDVLGEEGTLVFPTLVQKDFDQAYDTWHIDKHSDVGYLTNYFRKREGSIRSDQATHSVAASGKYAAYLTETHGHTHKRFGCYGDTPFSADSPWEKMYQMDTKTIFLGVEPVKATFRHLAEYMYVNELLDSVKDHPEFEALKDRIALRHIGKKGVWPDVANAWVAERMAEQGLLKTTMLGDALLTMFHAKVFMETVLRYLWNEEWDCLGCNYYQTGPNRWKDWLADCKRMQQELKNK